MTSGRKKSPDPQRPKSVILDTNLMLLQIVGSYDPLWVPKFKRTSSFSIDDFNRLSALVSSFRSAVTTPHVLAEVSNLLGQSGEPLKTELFKVLARLIARLQEIHVPADIVSMNPHFGRFGLTDLGMIEAARSGHMVLTADTPIAAYMLSQGVEVIDFNPWRR